MPKTGEGADCENPAPVARWRFFYDATTGAAKLLSAVDLPVITSSVRGFSLHPDGTRFATSIAKWPWDIWMLEGFE